MQDTAEEPPHEVDAAQAFEDLRGEVSVLRRAVEGLSGEWKANQPPDYTVTLGAIAKGLATVAGRLEGIEGHPALKLTPQQHQEAIAQACNALVREAVQKLEGATAAAAKEQQTLAGLIGSAHTQDKQLKWLLWTGGIALLLGLLASPIFARLLPFGLDGQVAAFILEADRWHAGATLMEAGSPEAWRGLMDDFNLVKSNQAALAACHAAAVQAKKEQRCTVVVPAP